MLRCLSQAHRASNTAVKILYIIIIVNVFDAIEK